MNERNVRLELWWSDDGTKMVGTDNQKDFLTCKNEHPTFVFIGRSVTYWVYCPNDDYTRDQALWFCDQHNRGKMTIKSFDLSTLNPPKKEKRK